MSDLIKREDAIKVVAGMDSYFVRYIEELPPAQPQRDIPKKPNEAVDRSWGISARQAVCPNCDAYLGVVYFLNKGGKKKVTYCASCGQAIDWEGWEEE